VSDVGRERYDLVAGQRLERLAALSDGIFAVAMTIMVLDLRVPAQEAHRSEHALWRALVHLGPQFLTYFLSFLTLGIFWLGQQAQLDHFGRGNRRLAWIHIAFLCAVALMPFSTSLLAEFVRYRLALAVYWLNLALLGALLYASLVYAERAGLLDSRTAAIHELHKRRIIGFQVVYAACFALCVVDTYVSIALLIAAQVFSILSARASPWRA
jgi:TMEM175 potassium channel family protein